jgi:hypothetical protein
VSRRGCESLKRGRNARGRTGGEATPRLRAGAVTGRRERARERAVAAPGRGKVARSEVVRERGPTGREQGKARGAVARRCGVGKGGEAKRRGRERLVIAGFDFESTLPTEPTDPAPRARE